METLLAKMDEVSKTVPWLPRMLWVKGELEVRLKDLRDKPGSAQSRPILYTKKRLYRSLGSRPNSWRQVRLEDPGLLPKPKGHYQGSIASQ